MKKLIRFCKTFEEIKNLNIIPVNLINKYNYYYYFIIIIVIVIIYINIITMSLFT